MSIYNLGEKAPRLHWAIFLAVQSFCNFGNVRNNSVSSQHGGLEIFQPSFPGFSLLLWERTLVAAGHVEMCVNKLRSGGRSSTKFWRLEDEILSGAKRKFLLQNCAWVSELRAWMKWTTLLTCQNLLAGHK